MPKMPPRPCTAPRCRNYATSGGRCDDHQVRHGWGKGSGSSHGYGGNWQRRKNRILVRDLHTCQNCLRNGLYAKADDVDHIINKAEGGNDADDNLEALCKGCHAAKTQRESQRARNPKRI